MLFLLLFVSVCRAFYTKAVFSAKTIDIFLLCDIILFALRRLSSAG